MEELRRIVAAMMERHVIQQLGSFSETFVRVITESQAIRNRNPSELTEVMCEKPVTENNVGCECRFLVLSKIMIRMRVILNKVYHLNN